jgi:nitrate/nitrite-specific signal transduction histidine kinase
MKNYNISTKIKILGAILIVTMFTVIFSTIYLNKKTSKDSLTINIAGKQRMLTQKITKNIYHINQSKDANFVDLDKAVSSFEFGLNTLKDGNKLLEITDAPTPDIRNQISNIIVLWNSFKKNIEEFKSGVINNNQSLKSASMRYVIVSNDELLLEVDKLVTLFTKHSERKTDYIKKFQYIAMAILLLLVVYSIMQLKEIEVHAREFIEKSKQIANADLDSRFEPINVEAESEIVEAADNINCFIDKLNSAMEYSSSAVEQSKNASIKLEELTDEFDGIINEMENSSAIFNQLDKSEDMALDSTENLMQTTKKLQELKKELDSLILTCKVDK